MCMCWLFGFDFEVPQRSVHSACFKLLRALSLCRRHSSEWYTERSNRQRDRWWVGRGAAPCRRACLVHPSFIFLSLFLSPSWQLAASSFILSGLRSWLMSRHAVLIALWRMHNLLERSLGWILLKAGPCCHLITL